MLSLEIPFPGHSLLLCCLVASGADASAPYWPLCLTPLIRMLRRRNNWASARWPISRPRPLPDSYNTTRTVIRFPVLFPSPTGLAHFPARRRARRRSPFSIS
ncbi:hypothetical protein PENSPDRAFT_307642 [Peniophora sp. CONT]|nr:hypothetical protein PENSPDRAFT_307642 [Peniophora sp. CONT]